MASPIVELPAFPSRAAGLGHHLLTLVKRHWLLIALVVAAFVTRFWRLWEPSEVVFDEVHFGKFITAYFTGEYFFDIHPPLGKLIIAAAGWIGGFEPGFSFENIGQPYGDTAYIALRVAPALFGALLVPLTYLLVKEMGGSNRAAGLGAGLVLLDNALIIESRFMLVDSILLSFGFLSLLLFLITMRQRTGSRAWLIYLPLTGIALGATVSTKWTGLGMVGVVGLVALIDLVKEAWDSNRTFMYKLMGYGVGLLIVPAGLYFGLWLLHFDLLPKSGQGDGFMSPEFRTSLEGATNTSESSLNSFQKVEELNRTIYRVNSGIRQEHPWQSEWWSWPFLPRGVSYWQSSTDDKTARIYLLGVPYLWWLVLLGAIAFPLVAARRLTRYGSTGDEERGFLQRSTLVYRGLTPGDRRFLKYGGLLVLGILANWLPFALIERPLFLYHYFFSLIFSMLLAALVFDRLWGRFGHMLRFRAIAVAAIVLLVLGFLLFTPITYGYALPNSLERAWFWFPDWQSAR